VAKKVTLIAVKVLACSGSGTVSGVISGVQYTADSAQRRGRRGVANMSLGGGYSAALNDAVAGAVKAGVAFAVAAGNENQDACNVSPASESSAITVGATFYSGNLAKDTRATFSNHGTCVDVFAPGQNIKSAWIGSDNAYNTISGTSMASPHAAGLAALILASNPNYTTDQIKGALLENSTPDQIDLQCTCWFCNCNKSPNKMLFTASC
jgi:subtilisin family serine protease